MLILKESIHHETKQSVYLIEGEHTESTLPQKVEGLTFSFKNTTKYDKMRKLPSTATKYI